MNTPRTASRILVWDLPTRLFHWSLAASFAGAWLSADSERWMDVHVMLGYTVLLLVVFRIAWGFLGTRHARFASFAYRPREVIAYLRAMVQRRAPHFTGHNPAGSWAIFGLIALAVVVTASGIATFNDAGGRWLEELHEGAATAMLVLVLVHVAGVLVGSLLHRENLVASMFSGRKTGTAQDAIGRPRRVVAAFLAVALAGVWSGAMPLPGIEAATGMTAIKADARGARHAGEDDD